MFSEGRLVMGCLVMGVRTEILFLDVIAKKFTRNYFYVLKSASPKNMLKL